MAPEDGTRLQERPAEALGFPPGELPEAAVPDRIDEDHAEPQPAAASDEPPAEAEEKASPRLLSLDAFRGLTILGMLLVNNMMLGEATPKQMTHAEWSGAVYFADLVFPWFLFIVGVATPFSAASAARRGLPGRQYAGKVLGRALALFFLGCLIDSSLAKQPVLGLDVLQLIGLAFAVGSLLYPLPPAIRLSAAAVLLLGHWAAIRFIPIPGIGAGSFTEEHNLITYVNQTYLEPYRMQGLVSIIPTSALVLIGTAVGDLFRSRALTPLRKAGILAGAGLVLTLAGWLWSFDLPFNKPVWTASYILVAAGAGGLVLSALYVLVDVAGRRALVFPLVVFGSNAIVAYVAPILTKVHVLQEWTWPAADGSRLSVQEALLHACFEQFGRPRGAWLYTAGYILFWWLVLLVLYRKRIFLKV